ncbi:hypothetical protein QBC42DRAFT_75434 [Cladorrhinum samala]|uniref:Uncharacterized protein n=1 Tax=Cladorrhinum samala TaxID=585594 RepID=A0AAV9I520_9PEZI|nr:hypothetical protein QBC42DRAFT_75434 [Cladorrhinum samala]
MECPSHQENSQRFGTATRKRTLDEAGASDNLNPDLGYTVCSKKPCTTYDLASQQLQYGGFTTSSADHQSWSTELSGQLTTSSSSMEGSISVDPWDDASVPLQILGARTYTTLNIATGQLGLESNWLPDFEAVGQQVSSQDFPVTEVLFGENCETFGLYDSAVVQPALDGPMGFCQPGDLSLLSGIVPQSQFNDMEIEPETDFSITDAADMRLSSASQADQSPWTDGIGAIEPATASTTPQTAPGGTDYELKGSNDDLVCDTCFGVVRTDSVASTPLQELLR